MFCIGNDATTRFWRHVDKGAGPDGCWPWLLSRRNGRYGQFRYDGHTYLTHRLAWQLHNNRQVPDSMEILHDCDNPPCCNPAHLRCATHAENCHDAAVRGLYRWGETSLLAKLTCAQVQEIRERLYAGETCATIARDYGVTRSAVYGVKCQRSWCRVPVPAKYVDTRMPTTRKLTQADADTIRGLVRLGGRQCDVAQAYGVSPATVCRIMNGSRWRAREGDEQ